MVAVELRPYRPEDKALVEEWMDGTAKKFLQPGWLDVDCPTNHRNDYALVAAENGVPRGLVYVAFYKTDEAQAFMLVAPDARGRGTGRQLLRRTLDTTTARIIRADVDKENERAAECALAAWFCELAPPDERDMRFFVWTRDERP